MNINLGNLAEGKLKEIPPQQFAVLEKTLEEKSRQIERYEIENLEE